jgi:hypothetical protein
MLPTNTDRRKLVSEYSKYRRDSCKNIILRSGANTHRNHILQTGEETYLDIRKKARRMHIDKRIMSFDRI